jgi:hypothetical protein
LTFVLGSSRRVYFTVSQVSPDCHPVGRFSVRGHKGVNHVPFFGRVGRKNLQPGTYTVSARTGSGAGLARVTLVVFAGPAPSPAALRAEQAANVCAAVQALTSILGGDPSGSGNASTPSSATPGVVPAPRHPSPHASGGVLGVDLADAARSASPFLIALLGAAILLLGTASLPQPAVPGGPVGDGLARHRGVIAGLGVAALVAAAFTFFLT